MTALRARWLRVAGPRERGMTLVEVSVTMLVLGFLTTAVMVLMNGTQRLAVQNNARLDQINAARVAVEAMSRSLRTAVLPSQLGATCADPAQVNDPNCTSAAFMTGTATSVQFYGNVNNTDNTIGPSRVTYALAGGVLTETVQAPDAHPATSFVYSYCTPGPSCPVRSRVLARGVQTSAPLFTYYDAAGQVITATTLSAADLAKVDAMDVVVSVQQPAKVTAPASTFVQRVALPNADSVFRNDNN